MAESQAAAALVPRVEKAPAMLPCPHCGAPPRLVVLGPHGGKYGAGVVCSAGCLDAFSPSHLDAGEEAFKRWNKRWP